jgi:hypothetical protein
MVYTLTVSYQCCIKLLLKLYLVFLYTLRKSDHRSTLHLKISCIHVLVIRNSSLPEFLSLLSALCINSYGRIGFKLCIWTVTRTEVGFANGTGQLVLCVPKKCCYILFSLKSLVGCNTFSNCVTWT